MHLPQIATYFSLLLLPGFLSSLTFLGLSWLDTLKKCLLYSVTLYLALHEHKTTSHFILYAFICLLLSLPLDYVPFYQGLFFLFINVFLDLKQCLTPNRNSKNICQLSVFSFQCVIICRFSSFIFPFPKIADAWRVVFGFFFLSLKQGNHIL